MKKFSIFCFAIVLLNLVSLNSYGQKKEITAEEYIKLRDKIGENTRKLSYRLINEKTIYTPDGTKIQQTEKNISEYVPTERQRFLSQMKNYEINRDTVIETIKIDGIEYKKYNNGKWEIVSALTKIGDKNIEPEKTYTRYYLTKNIQIGGQIADILEYEEEYVSRTKYVKSGEVVEIPIHQSWNWIIKDGLWSSFEMINEKVSPKTLLLRSVWNYEYDPNIKIEAPIVSEDVKP